MMKEMLSNITGNARFNAGKSVENTLTDKMNRVSDGKFSKQLDSVVSVKDKERKIDKKLMNACVEMESIFVAKMLKEMRKTVHKGDMMHGGFAEEIFEDMLYDKYAMNISQNANLGLAKTLYNQLSTLNNPGSVNRKG